jgi:hypothetical protein
MRIAVLAAALCLAGCQTVGAIRNDPPRAAYVSDRTPLELEYCLAGAIGSTNVIHGPYSTEIVSDDRGAVLFHIKLVPQGAKTSVEVRSMGIIGYPPVYRKKVEACVSAPSRP